MNQDAVAAAVRGLLVALGEDPDREGLQETPARVARAWRELLAGREQEAESVLKTTFAADGYDEVVALQGIPFHSLCEHHLLPFVGQASIAYVPAASGRVVGLSKLARLVEMHARRLQLQERLTRGIADDLERVLKPVGVAVIVSATHHCMCARGVSKSGAEMRTSVMLGCFREKPEARAEVMELLR